MINNNLHQLKAAPGRLEAEHGPEHVYDFCSGFHDAVMRGHTSHPDDNPHMPDERPCFDLYQLGARTAEPLREAQGIDQRRVESNSENAVQSGEATL
jgi:hypothetical protein